MPIAAIAPWLLAALPLQGGRTAPIGPRGGEFDPNISRALVAGDLWPDAPSAQTGARLSVEPRIVEVGQAMRWTIEVVHAPGGAPVPLASDLGLDPSWGVLELGTWESVPLPDDPTLRRSVAELTVVSLEPGTRDLPEIALVSAAGERWVASVPVPIEVASALAEGEDSPRPLRGFRALPDDAAASARWPWITAGAALLAALAAAFALVRARRARRMAPRAPTPIERLAEIERRIAAGAAEPGDAHAELARLVREALTHPPISPAGAAPAGATDEEWLAAWNGPVETRARAEEILKRCSAVRFAGQVPTEWAARETLAGARALIEAGAAASGGEAR